MYKSVKEIDEAYKEHLESLELSGLEFDRESVIADWAYAVALFEGK